MTPIGAKLGREVLILDGSMGAFLMQGGLPAGLAPDLWTLQEPDVVAGVHAQYVEAGAQIVLTNTFGATAPRLAAYGAAERVAEVNRAAVEVARRAAGDRAWVAGDVGGLGETVAPAGTLPFAAAVDHFAAQVRALVDAGVDLLVLETFIDLTELRAAVIAANEHRGEIPLIASMSFGPDAVTDTGVTPEAAAATLQGLGVDGVGVNCSTGPEAMLPVVERLVAATALPVAVQPNAGLPLRRDGALVFPMTPEEMAPWYERFVAAGAAIVGGCCGTRPETIRLAAERVAGRPLRPRAAARGVTLASRSEVRSIGPGRPFAVIGERINPTGKPRFAAALRDGRLDRVLGAARRQAEAGADALDVNVGVPGIDEAETMRAAVAAIQNAVELPLVLDSSDPAALAAGLEAYAGRALLNSVPADERAAEVLGLARRHGAAVLLLPTGEAIPEDLEGRMRYARSLVEQARAAGLGPQDLVLDVLALAVSAMQDGAASSLAAARAFGAELGVATICGLSNISFGLPRRGPVHRTYLAMAMAHGLDAAIADPLDGALLDVVAAASLFCGRDPECRRYLAHAASHAGDEGAAPPGTATVSMPAATVTERLGRAVIDGDRGAAAELAGQALEEGGDALGILLQTLTPAIRELGEQFGRREKYLPHLVAGAEAMQRAVAVLQPALDRGDRPERGTVVFGTVAGDVHDIGKNICVLMLRTAGFEVVDLGRSVSAERFVEAAREHDADVVAMSALMTTTMDQMGVVIERLRAEGARARTVVGGAVLGERAARELGADAYVKDAGVIADVVAGLVEAPRDDSEVVPS